MCLPVSTIREFQSWVCECSRRWPAACEMASLPLSTTAAARYYRKEANMLFVALPSEVGPPVEAKEVMIVKEPAAHMPSLHRARTDAPV